jgi:endonuclease/exonuclease/phosphatase family metal-dependent hydrolase
MKMIFRSALIAFVALILLNCSSDVNSLNSIKVMSFNIRLNVESDSMNAWSYRKEKAASMIRFHDADIAGLQEALHDQVKDLEEYLPEYNWIGIGRDDGKVEGEFMAVFFLRERFLLIEDSTFWLSENPEMPGIGWDAACNRVVTWGRFLDKSSQKEFYFFNTHFDHMGETARIESAKLLISSIAEIAKNNNIIVTGDFNSTPSSEVYSILTKRYSDESLIDLYDAKDVSMSSHHGPSFTFTGFDLSKLSNNDKLIDYIFVSKSVNVLKHGFLSDTFDGRFPSDHLPVIAETVFSE